MEFPYNHRDLKKKKCDLASAELLLPCELFLICDDVVLEILMDSSIWYQQWTDVFKSILKIIN